MTKWDKLIGMLEARRSTLVGFKDLVGLFREMDGAHGDLQDIEVLKIDNNIHLFAGHRIKRPFLFALSNDFRHFGFLFEEKSGREVT